MAGSDVQDLVEELADMEAQTDPFRLRKRLRINAFLEEPALGRCAEFQLVAVILRFEGGEGGADLRHGQMADADELVLDLLALGLQLPLIRQRLPAATAADAEMLAKGRQTLGGWLHDPLDAAFHVILFLLEDADVDDIAGHGEIDENDDAFVMGQGFAFGGDGLDRDAFYQ